MVKKSDFPKTSKGNIIRLDDSSDPSVRHEEASPAANQRALRAMGIGVSSPWKIPGVMTRLHEYAKQKLTSRQIAARLNHEFSVLLSRKAVIGALNRQGIAPSQKSNQQPKNKPTRHSPRALQVKPRLVIEEIAEPTPRGDVADGCRFLHGDAIARNFCGEKTASGPWCKFHRKKVYHVQDYTRQEKNWRRTI